VAGRTSKGTAAARDPPLLGPAAIRRVALKTAEEKRAAASSYIFLLVFHVRGAENNMIRYIRVVAATAGAAVFRVTMRVRESSRRIKAPLISAYAIDGRDGFYHALSALVKICFIVIIITVYNNVGKR
jgi:hypothetical protein